MAKSLRSYLDLRQVLEKQIRYNKKYNTNLDHLPRLEERVTACTEMIKFLSKDMCEVQADNYRAEKIKTLESLVIQRRELLERRDAEKYASETHYVCRSLASKIASFSKKINALNRELNYLEDENIPFIPSSKGGKNG